MERRAVVLKVEGRHATVLVEGGEIRRIRPPLGAAAGQTVWVPERSAWTGVLWAPAAAAAVLLAAAGLVLARPAATPVQAATVLSVDINPSLDLGLSATGRVVSVTPFDAAARALLTRMPALDGDSVAVAVADIVRTAHEAGYLRGPRSPGGDYLLLAGAPVTPQARGAAARALRAAVAAAAHATVNWRVHLVWLPVSTPAMTRRLQGQDVSLGRYLLSRARHISVPEAKRQSLGRLLAPGRARNAAHGRGHGRPTIPGAASAGATGGASPAAASSSADGAATAGTITRQGSLTGVGATAVSVGGITYAVAPGAQLASPSASQSYTAQAALAYVGHAVVVTLNAQGVVIRITVGSAASTAPPPARSAPVGSP